MDALSKDDLSGDRAYLFYIYEIIGGLEVLYRRTCLTSDPKKEVFNLLLQESRDHSELSPADCAEAKRAWEVNLLSLEGRESTYICRGWREITLDEMNIILKADAIH